LPTTVYLPIDFQVPDVRSGQAYWTVVSGTAKQMGVWEFLSGNEGRIHGYVHVPNIIAATPAAQVSLVCKTASNSGNTWFEVQSAAIASGASFDATLNIDSGYSVTVPSTAQNRFDILFPSGGTLATTVSGNSVLIVEVRHSGPTTTHLVEGLLRVDLS